jgi:ornithine decarboxylase
MLVPISRPAWNQYPSHDGAGPHSNKASTIEHGLESITNLSVKCLSKQLLDSQFTGKWEMEQDNAFAICDLGDVYRQYLKWVRHLPRVKPFYGKKKNKSTLGDLKNFFFGIISAAMKAFPDPKVIRLLASLGVGFDCASKMEIQKVLHMGVDPDQIIYANPCKQASHIHYSAQKKVYKMTFDNSDELYKIKSFHPHAKLVIRILPNDHLNQKGQLGAKYGATLAAVPRLLCLAKELSLDVIGAR